MPKCMSLATIAAPVAVRDPARAQLFAEPVHGRLGPARRRPARRVPGRYRRASRAAGLPGGVDRRRPSAARRRRRRAGRESAPGPGGGVVRSARVSISSSSPPRCRSTKHGVADQDRVLGRHGCGVSRRTAYSNGRAPSAVEPGVDAGDVGVEDRPVGRPGAGRRRRGHGRGSGAARSVLSAAIVADPSRAESSPAPARRSRSIWKNRSCAWTKPSARERVDARSRP